MPKCCAEWCSKHTCDQPQCMHCIGPEMGCPYQVTRCDARKCKESICSDWMEVCWTTNPEWGRCCVRQEGCEGAPPPWRYCGATEALHAMSSPSLLPSLPPSLARGRSYSHCSLGSTLPRVLRVTLMDGRLHRPSLRSPARAAAATPIGLPGIAAATPVVAARTATAALLAASHAATLAAAESTAAAAALARPVVSRPVATAAAPTHLAAADARSTLRARGGGDD